MYGNTMVHERRKTLLVIQFEKMIQRQRESARNQDTAKYITAHPQLPQVKNCGGPQAVFRWKLWGKRKPATPYCKRDNFGARVGTGFIEN